MLTWDDHITPASKTAANPMPPQPTGAQVSLSPEQAKSSQAPAVARRINAADKRIINGQTDVNQLVPSKYKWAWEK